MPLDRPSAIARLAPRRPAHALLARGLAAGLLLPALLCAQVVTDWVAPSGGVCVAVDAANNAFTATYAQALGAEISVTKHDVNGNLLWTVSHDQTDSTKWEQANWVAVDGAGSVIVSGTLMSGFSNPVKAASILLKFASDGSFLWRRVYESAFDGSSTRKCLVDADGNIYVLGLGIGPPGLVTKVKKFTPAGDPLWSYFNADGIGAPVNFKFTPDGQIVIAARGITGSINGYAKLTLDGQHAWSLAGVNSLTVGDAAGDSFGNTYLVHGEYVANGGTVLKKLDRTGKLLWEHTYALSAFRVEVGSDDRAVACGFPNSGSPGAAFIKVDGDGGLLWSNLDADGPLGLLLHSQLLLDESNDAYLAAGTLFEMAVCKVNSDGSSAWTQTIPGGGFAYAMAFGSFDNSLFVVGGSTARLLDSDEGPWQNLGLGLAGAGGVPLLYGQGQLSAGAPMTLAIAQAPPAAPAWLVLGRTAANLPFAGGVLVPAPDLVLGGLMSNAAGEWQASAAWPAGFPSGFELYLQAWFPDAGAVAGRAGSNALRATTP